MATDILINAGKGKGRGYVIGSERWPRCEEWPAWAERFVQQRGYYRSDETKETPAEGGGSPHGGEQSQERRPSLCEIPTMAAAPPGQGHQKSELSMWAAGLLRRRLRAPPSSVPF